MKRVAIVGMGFAGLQAARGLAGRGLELVLLDRNNYHLFTALLYQVATASVEPESIVYPIREITRRWPDTRFRMTNVLSIDLDRRDLHTPQGAIGYDYLVLAPGSVTNFLSMPSVTEHAFPLKDLSDASSLRNHVLRAFEDAAQEPDASRREGLLTFVVVGGGPTGVEYAGALAELVRWELRKDHPRLSDEEVRIILLEALDRLLVAFPERLSEYALQRLKGMGIDVLLNSRVVRASKDRVHLEDGSAIGTRTLVWTAGIRAEPLAASLPGASGPGGTILVEPDLTLPGHSEVYVVGDAAYVEQDGRRLPQMAPVAIQEGQYCARAILARERGEDIGPFQYRDRGMMAVVGRGKAVATILGISFGGFVAWLIWIALHLVLLIGFRNRLVVLINWASDYLLFDRKLRIITSVPPPPTSGGLSADRSRQGS